MVCNLKIKWIICSCSFHPTLTTWLLVEVGASVRIIPMVIVRVEVWSSVLFLVYVRTDTVLIWFVRMLTTLCFIAWEGQFRMYRVMRKIHVGCWMCRNGVAKDRNSFYATRQKTAKSPVFSQCGSHHVKFRRHK
jgi:hypothetical protein